MNQADDLQMLLRRYQAGLCTPEEQRQVEAWYEKLESGQPLLLTTKEREKLRKALWSRIAINTSVSGAIPALRGAGVVRWVAAAAVAAGLGLGAWYMLPEKPAGHLPSAIAQARPSTWRTFRNSSQQDMPLTLPDSSTVLLTPASRLYYPAQFRGGPRRVRLVGEAFFHVRSDAAHPFQVYTEQLVTTVLGTSFRVRAHAGQPEALVKVSTGRVLVAPRRMPALVSKAGVVVLPNHQVVYAAGAQPLRRELVAEPVLLLPQSFAFTDRPVAEVLAALATAYGVDIHYDAPALAGCTVTLNLQSKSLHGKLEVLCKVLGATYKEQDAHIEFRSPSCLNP